MPRTEWDSIVAGKAAGKDSPAAGVHPPPEPDARGEPGVRGARAALPVDDGFEDDDDLTVDDSRGGHG